MSELLKINVNEHTEKKQGLTYLSWAWAWAEVLKLDAEAQWAPLYFGPESHRVPYLSLPDGSMMVGVQVHIRGIVRSCLLPVMDHRNRAIKNPDAFAVNTALMRCLAKAIAMHGLGLYIYAGEDLPEGEEGEAPRTTGSHSGPAIAFEEMQPEQQDWLRRAAQQIVEQVAAGALTDARQIIDMTLDSFDDRQHAKAALWSLLDSKTRAAIKKHEAEKDKQ